jgi:PAS domain S-box-containing protein
LLDTAGTDPSDHLPVLYRLTDELYRAQSLEDIFAAALAAIVPALGSRASILLFDDAGVMQFVASRGLSEEYRERLRGHTPWRPDDTSAEPIFVSDIDATDEPTAVKSVIRNENIRSLAFIPLFGNGRVIGKFMTYHAGYHEFSKAERQLAVVVARQLAFSIERYRAEAARRAAVDSLKESEERFRQLSEDAPVMIWMSDAQGHCLYLNRVLRDFWGVELDDIAGFDFQTTIHPDDAARVAGEMMNAAIGRVPVLVEGRYRRSADGTYRWLRTQARPRLIGDEFVGMTGANVDVTDEREAERTLRESEQRLRVALSAGRMGTWRHDIRTGEEIWDARQRELFGIDPETPVSRSFRLSRIYPPDLPKVDAGAGEDLGEDRASDTEFRVVLPDGRLRWLAGMSVARVDESGAPVERIGVNFDISEQKETEGRLRLLVDELNHRVKNILTVVQSLAYQTFKGTAADGARRAFEGRLMTLASSHSYLSHGEWEGVLLNALAQRTFISQGVAAGRFSLTGPTVLLQPNQAFALALAFHELCTNAIKYGALSNDRGCVNVEWTQGEALRICWREADGPEVRSPGTRGFGSRLIDQALARDLRGHVSLAFEPAGVQCTIEIPPTTARSVD